MGVKYGVLRGRVDRFEREADPKSPHLQIRVQDGHGAPWRIATNVLSSDPQLSLVVFHRVDPLVSHPILAGLSSLAAGFTPLPAASRSASNCLDYFRAPLFDWPTGIAIPANGPGAEDDLQDVLVTYMTQLVDQEGEIYAFGSMFDDGPHPSHPLPIDQAFGTSRGMHDIHMNQGNPPGRFEGDNGVFQDGGLILRFATRHVGIFLRFRSQWLPTDNVRGNRVADSHDIPPGTSIPDQPTPETHPNVYIERALVNPRGDDPGREVVVLGNATTAAVDLAGWSLADKNGNRRVLTGLVLPAGESRLVALTGANVQLSNKGGTITLTTPSGAQAHAVSYSKADASAEDRYVRFTT